MPVARLALPSDLDEMLSLFAESEVSAAVQPREQAEKIWQRTMASDSVAVFVVEVCGGLVATCTLITAPNLLRDGRQHGFLENVVTHPRLRGQGFGRAVVRAALEYAWAADCHHVLMQSGRADPRVHSFYQSLGFLPGLRVGYAALRPQDQAGLTV